jgi:biopolymer transport protein ExbB
MTSAALIGIFDSIPLWVMIAPLILSSIILLALLIERLSFFRKQEKDTLALLEKLPQYWKSGELPAFLEGRKGIISRYLYDVLVEHDGLPDETILKLMAEKKLQVVERFTGVVSTLATVSPMLGLLGTVTGMMKSFSGLAQKGGAAQMLLAGGITEALITTALGLIVAIPALIFYNYLVSQIDRIQRELEQVASMIQFLVTGENR